MSASALLHSLCALLCGVQAGSPTRPLDVRYTDQATRRAAAIEYAERVRTEQLERLQEAQRNARWGWAAATDFLAIFSVGGCFAIDVPHIQVVFVTSKKPDWAHMQAKAASPAQSICWGQEPSFANCIGKHSSSGSPALLSCSAAGDTQPGE